MRAVFGILGLLIVAAVVGLLATKQLAATRQVTPDLSPEPAMAGAASPATPVKEQSQQLQQQYKQAVEAAVQPSRAVPEEK